MGQKDRPIRQAKGMDGGVQWTKASRIKILVRIKDSLSPLSIGNDLDRYSETKVRKKFGPKVDRT